MHLRRSATVVLTVPALLVGAALPAAAAEVVVVNSTDGRTLGAADAEVVFVRDGRVDSTNSAQALGKNCTGCRTGAMALQLVLVAGRTDSLTPSNSAIAVNEKCSGCYTIAQARQVVLTVPAGSQLSRRGKERLAKLDRRADRTVAELLKAQATAAQVDAAADRLEEELRALADELRHDES
ncbi:MAG: hypothetical protein JWN57_1738 [Frankiales bacterium]|nr:hypothetical protein [Frankiales bacterium]